MGVGVIGERTYKVSCYIGRACRSSSILLELFCGEEEEEGGGGEGGGGREEEEEGGGEGGGEKEEEEEENLLSSISVRPSHP